MSLINNKIIFILVVTSLHIIIKHREGTAELTATLSFLLLMFNEIQSAVEVFAVVRCCATSQRNADFYNATETPQISDRVQFTVHCINMRKDQRMSGHSSVAEGGVAVQRAAK